jgi:small-conductance mechanosensitive channel
MIDPEPRPEFLTREPPPVPLGAYGRLFVAALRQYHDSSSKDPLASAAWFMTVMTLLPVTSAVCLAMAALMKLKSQRIVLPFIHVAALAALLLVFGISQRIAHHWQLERHVGDVTLMESRWLMWRTVLLLLALFVASVLVLGYVASGLGPA